MCVISLCGYDVIGYLYGSYPYLGMMLSKLRFDRWTSLRKQFGCVKQRRRRRQRERPRKAIGLGCVPLGNMDLDFKIRILDLQSISTIGFQR